MASDGQIFVVLATWNGAEYVAEQIESVLRQSVKEWTLLVRDDGSCDGTADIVCQYCEQDGRIEWLGDESGRLGPDGNFERLLKTALRRGAAYVLVSDQDDVWHPEKLAEQLRLMRQIEADAGRDSPSLVYSDLEVTDADLGVIHCSFNEHASPPHGEVQFLTALLQRNYIPGCSMLINRPLLELALPMPDIGIIYDHWLALCAAAAGSMQCVPQPLLKYRRHSGNVTPTGTSTSTPAHQIRRLVRGEHLSDKTLKRLQTHVNAARELLKRVSWKDGGFRQPVLEEYSSLFEPGVSAFRRVNGLRRLGLPFNRSQAGRLVYYLQMMHLESG